MRAILTSLGTAGDAEPIIALALELRKLGIDPVLALSSTYQNRAREYALEFVATGPEFSRESVRQIVSEQLQARNPITQATAFVSVMQPYLGEMYETIAAVCRRADVLIAVPYQMVAPMVHEKIGIPYVSVHLSPVGERSVGRLRAMTAAPLNEFRRSIGLRSVDDPLTVDAVSRQLALFAVSRLVYRNPSDWPANRHVTGFFFVEEPKWQPDPHLAAFASSKKPIVITFGSMVTAYPDALTQVLIEGLQIAGRPAIIQHGWGGLGSGGLPAEIRAVGRVPHSWLFQHAACVVHHGGAGTTAATLRAGVPSVVVPHILDQPLWAEILKGMGCARRSIPLRELSAKRLASALDETLGSSKCRDAARKVSLCMKHENGAAKAAGLVAEVDRTMSSLHE